MKTNKTQNVAHKKNIIPNLPMIWLVPIVALVVALWMIYPQYIDRGTQITIEFPAGDGLQPDNTVLEYRGVPAGKVKAVTLKKDMKGVTVVIRLDENAKALARRGSKFWVEKPQVGLGGVSGLDTLLSGAHINVIPGPMNGPEERSFIGMPNPPALNQPELGCAFFVYNNVMGTLQPHASVFYKNFKVGEVETTQMTSDGRGFLTRLRIYAPYVKLVRTNTVFWDAGGLSVNMSLFGANIKTTSLESIISGAIAFATPDEPGPIAVDGTQFRLFPKAQDEWQKWAPAIQIQPADTMPERSKDMAQELEQPLNAMKTNSDPHAR